MKDIRKTNQNLKIKVLPNGQIEANGQPSGLTALFPQEAARADEFAQKYHGGWDLTLDNTVEASRLSAFNTVAALLFRAGAQESALEVLRLGITHSKQGMQSRPLKTGSMTDGLSLPSLVEALACHRHSSFVERAKDPLPPRDASVSLSPTPLAYDMSMAFQLCGGEPDLIRDWLVQKVERYARVMADYWAAYERFAVTVVQMSDPALDL